MDKKTRNTVMFLIIFGVVVYASVMNLEKIWGFVLVLGRITLPILIGLMLAFILNVPMRAYEKMLRWLFRNSKKQPHKRLIYVVSLILAVISIALVLTLAATIAVPEFIESSKSIVALVKEKMPEFLKVLEKHNVDTSSINSWLSNVDINNLISNIGSGAGTVLSSIFNIASATVSGFVSFIFAIVIAFYVLVSKDTVSRHSKKLVYLIFKKNIADYICNVAQLSDRIFSQYLSGQCIEACILGILITLSFVIFRIPYAGIIGIMTGISAFIPYVGAFIACFFGAFLILLISPMQALISIIIFCVVQFIETQFIYPHVVGGSVGLSPLITLLAALVGAKAMGLFGIVFFIPLTAVLYTLAKEYTNKRLEEKNIIIK